MNHAEGHRVWSCCLRGTADPDESEYLERELRERNGDFVEEARLLEQYIRAAGCSQEECARRLGRSQSSVANRLRLLKLPEDVLEALAASRLTERHGRALLRLSDPQLQRQALEVMERQELSVAAAEAYVESLLPPAGRRSMALADAGILQNTLERSAEALRRCGVACEIGRRETETELILTIRIPKGQKSSLQKKEPVL